MTSTLSDKREHVIPCIGLSRSPFWSRAASAASSVRVRSMRRMSDGRRCRWTFDHRRWGRFSGGQPRRHRSLVDALPKTPTMIGFDAKSSKTWDSSTDRPHTFIYHPTQLTCSHGKGCRCWLTLFAVGTTKNVDCGALRNSMGSGNSRFFLKFNCKIVQFEDVWALKFGH